MDEQQAWRDVLAEIIYSRSERIRLAKAVGVDPITLTRWVNGTSRPRTDALQRLLNALPPATQTRLRPLLEQEFTDLVLASKRPEPPQTTSISIELYERVLHAKSYVPKRLLFHTLCDLILDQALKQLDPSRDGLLLVVSGCLPPATDKNPIRSLRLLSVRGSGLWANLSQNHILFGLESLTGHTAAAGHLLVNQHLQDPLHRAPGYPVEGIQSAVAVPLMNTGRVAGCLSAACARAEAFAHWRLTVLEQYAHLLALAFEERAFYEPSQLMLGILPPAQIQLLHLSGFQQRVSELLKQATRANQFLSILEAEQQIWQQVEDELLQQASQMTLSSLPQNT
jgi:hypothetical protein